MNKTITPSNWNYSYYKCGDLRAQIFLGADPYCDEILYLVTSTDLNCEKEYFQREFINLDKAINFINERFSHFHLVEGVYKESESGCGSCSAH